MAAKRKLDTSCQQEKVDVGNNEAIQMIPLGKLQDFKDHPFKVETIFKCKMFLVSWDVFAHDIPPSTAV